MSELPGKAVYSQLEPRGKGLWLVVMGINPLAWMEDSFSHQLSSQLEVLTSNSQLPTQSKFPCASQIL